MNKTAVTQYIVERLTETHRGIASDGDIVR